MSVAFQLPELGLLTLAMFIPILSGGLNLCIIATANLTSLLMAWVFLTCLPPDAGMMMQAVWLTLALVGAMILALVIGMLTGALVAYVGAHPILVTLATMTMVNGVGIYLSRGAAISGMPDIVRFIGAETLLGVPVPLIIFLLTAVLVAVLLERTRFGKVAGVVLSLIVLQVISTGLNLMNVSPHFSLAMWGAVLIVVLAVKFFRSRYLQKRAGRMSAAKARAAQS